MRHLKKEGQVMENAGEKLLSLARRAGADRAEVCVSYSQQSKIALEKQDFHLASTDDGFSFGLRVIKDGRQGFSSCNTSEPSDLKEIANLAVQIAEFSPKNPNYDIPAGGNIPNEAPKSLFDTQLQNLSLQTQKDWITILYKEALAHPKFRINEGTVDISTGASLIMNSVGTHKSEEETMASWSLMGMAVDGDTITSFDYFQGLSRKASNVPNSIADSTRSFIQQVVSNLKQGPAKSYKGLVAFSPRAVIDIFISNLSYHFSGRNLLEQTARWKSEDMDKKVADERFTLVDNPWLPDRYGCTLFDREGIPTKPIALLSEGVLRSWLTDSYSAKGLNLASTGHAAGGAASIPTVSPHSLCLMGGVESREKLFQQAFEKQENLLLVHRFSGQVDPITGDFSGVAKGGEWWTQNEKQHCVNETMISGNLFECLSSSLFGLSVETHCINGGYESPYGIWDGISVTSGS